MSHISVMSMRQLYFHPMLNSSAVIISDYGISPIMFIVLDLKLLKIYAFAFSIWRVVLLKILELLAVSNTK